MQVYRYSLEWDGIKFNESMSTVQLTAMAADGAVCLYSDGRIGGYLYTTKYGDNDSFTRIAAAISERNCAQLAEITNCQLRLAEVFNIKVQEEK